jgi:microcin C transport system permease protein
VTGYFIRRLLLIIPTFIGITAAVYVITYFVPGGPIERQILSYKMAMITEGGAAGASSNLSRDIPPEAIEEMKKFYGFDKPWYVGYAKWLANVVRLDLGTSYVYQDPVWDVIKRRFPVSIFLGLTGFVLSYLVCVPLGVLKAIKHGSNTDPNLTS